MHRAASACTCGKNTFHFSSETAQPDSSQMLAAATDSVTSGTTDDTGIESSSLGASPILQKTQQSIRIHDSEFITNDRKRIVNSNVHIFHSTEKPLPIPPRSPKHIPPLPPKNVQQRCSKHFREDSKNFVQPKNTLSNYDLHKSSVAQFPLRKFAEQHSSNFSNCCVRHGNRECKICTSINSEFSPTENKCFAHDNSKINVPFIGSEPNGGLFGNQSIRCRNDNSTMHILCPTSSKKINIADGISRTIRSDCVNVRVEKSTNTYTPVFDTHRSPLDDCSVHHFQQKEQIFLPVKCSCHLNNCRNHKTPHPINSSESEFRNLLFPLSGPHRNLRRKLLDTNKCAHVSDSAVNSSKPGCGGLQWISKTLSRLFKTVDRENPSISVIDSLQNSARPLSTEGCLFYTKKRCSKATTHCDCNMCNERVNLGDSLCNRRLKNKIAYTGSKNGTPIPDSCHSLPGATSAVHVSNTKHIPPSTPISLDPDLFHELLSSNSNAVEFRESLKSGRMHPLPPSRIANTPPPPRPVKIGTNNVKAQSLSNERVSLVCQCPHSPQGQNSCFRSTSDGVQRNDLNVSAAVGNCSSASNTLELVGNKLRRLTRASIRSRRNRRLFSSDTACRPSSSPIPACTNNGANSMSNLCATRTTNTLSAATQDSSLPTLVSDSPVNACFTPACVRSCSCPATDSGQKCLSPCPLIVVPSVTSSSSPIHHHLVHHHVHHIHHFHHHHHHHHTHQDASNVTHPTAPMITVSGSPRVSAIVQPAIIPSSSSAPHTYSAYGASTTSPGGSSPPCCSPRIRSPSLSLQPVLEAGSDRGGNIAGTNCPVTDCESLRLTTMTNLPRIPSTAHDCDSSPSDSTVARVHSGLRCTHTSSELVSGSPTTANVITDTGPVGTATTSAAPSNSRVLLDSYSSFRRSMLELRKMGWYWGPLTFQEAQILLAKRPDGTFLVRDSGHDTYILSLSFRVRGETYHTRIEHNQGRFSFWSQPQTHSASTMVEFIEKAVAHSISGQFHYFLQSSALGQPPVEVPLLYPLSRFQVVPSLRHLTRFAILSCVRRDHIEQLPLPPPILSYLLEKQCFAESLEEFEKAIRDRSPLEFRPRAAAAALDNSSD